MASRAEREFSTGRPIRISKLLRRELEAAIQAHLTAVEKLTTVLDRADGESELEPSLAGDGYSGGYDLEADSADDEPSLGSPAGATHCQLHWADGAGDDREDDGDDREPDVDREPNLCPWS